jgi:Mce-associated membrane protein
MSADDLSAVTETGNDVEPAVEEQTSDDLADSTEPADDTVRDAGRSWLRWLAPVTLTVLLAVSVGVAGWLYFSWYKTDQQIGESGQQSALNAASDGVVAVLSYAPDTLDRDFANAKKHLTGDFLNYYTDYTQRIVTPAAKEKSVKTAAAVIRKSLIEIHPDTAQVLLFINQNTSSKSMPDGSYSASAVKVGLQKHDGTWLISSFDPV